MSLDHAITMKNAPTPVNKLQPNTSIIRKSSKADKKHQTVSFLEGDNKTAKVDTIEHDQKQPEKQMDKSQSHQELADAVTKRILQKCNIIRSKHPNSKKLNIKERLFGITYDKILGKVKRVQSKRLRNTNLKTTLDTHHASIQLAL